NATFTADRPMRAAILSLGYADGYRRAFSNAGSFWIGGVEARVLGRISMDLAIIALPDDEQWVAEPWAGAVYRLCEAQEQSGLSQYELLTALGERFDRHWM
ncbi:MAG: alanine racemase, partial [Novosphingopyxis baekryungensis]|nr:alanine racemase [Novosphingopyxis baekryungensis]